MIKHSIPSIEPTGREFHSDKQIRWLFAYCLRHAVVTRLSGDAKENNNLVTRRIIPSEHNISLTDISYFNITISATGNE